MNFTPLLLPIFLTTGFNGTFPAYIGPGSGLSVIGAVLAVLAAIATAIFGFLWYPIKRILGKSKKKQEPEPTMDEED